MAESWKDAPAASNTSAQAAWMSAPSASGSEPVRGMEKSSGPGRGGVASTSASSANPSALQRFGSNFIDKLNPVPAIRSYVEGGPVMGPVNVGTPIVEGALREGGKTLDAIRGTGEYAPQPGRSDYTPTERALSAAGHGLATVLPGIGPAAADAGEQIGSGDFAGGLGSSAALLTGAMLPEAGSQLAKVPAVRALGRGIAGAGKGAYEGATRMVPVNLNRFGVGVDFNVPAPVMGGAIGSGVGASVGAPFGLHAPGSVIGGTVGTVAPIVRGGIRGFREGMQGFDRSAWPQGAESPYRVPSGVTVPRSPGAYDPLSESGGVGPRVGMSGAPKPPDPTAPAPFEPYRPPQGVIIRRSPGAYDPLSESGGTGPRVGMSGAPAPPQAPVPPTPEPFQPYRVPRGIVNRNIGNGSRDTAGVSSPAAIRARSNELAGGAPIIKGTPSASPNVAPPPVAPNSAPNATAPDYSPITKQYTAQPSRSSGKFGPNGERLGPDGKPMFPNLRKK